MPWKTAKLPTDLICFIMAPTQSEFRLIREKWCAIAIEKELAVGSPL